MKATIQIRVIPDEAREFAYNLSNQGYEICSVDRDGVTDIHFKLNGKTSIDYCVTIFEDHAFIGVRPA